MEKIPFLQPNPAKLSESLGALRKIEQSHIISNYGPFNTEFEQRIGQMMFGGVGACLTVCNATAGLMLAIQRCAVDAPQPVRYALMPSFTFAATAHAAIWAGLTPLFCDIDEDSWLPSERSERALLDQFGSQISVVVPYATFGNVIDLARYHRLASEYGVGVVIDAAASLGAVADDGRAFGLGCTYPLVFSMHATKAFATAEAGLVYCADADVLKDLRTMANFGLDEFRTTIMPGLNAKLNEIVALMALLKLGDFDACTAHRATMARFYRQQLPELTFQRLYGQQHAYMFVSALLPEGLAGRRTQIVQRLAHEGIELRTYFSPHLAEHPYFHRRAVSGDLSVTNRIAPRFISLPLSDFITFEQVKTVCSALRRALS
jgi:dTDP-4-amino-4,6-dideoxygalactose transaminase